MAGNAAALAPGTVIGGHFAILRKLGGGGMGEVFLAENLNVKDKKYAIKVLLREFTGDALFVKLLHDEAAKQARLEHDNVVGMYDFFEWEGHFCLLQSYIKGKTLADLLTEQPEGLARDTALDLMGGILAGLDCAHANGILHCDIKPANVIIDPDGRPHVTDFGISRDIGTSPAALGGAGTVDYMSPEQLLPPYEIDHRSDVYSAGVVLFQMLCGQRPFKRSQGQTADLHDMLKPDAPDIRSLRADVPEPVARIVATALQRDPDQRFQGCQDFALAIEEFRRRERWRRTWLPAIAVISVLALIGAAGLYQWRRQVSDEVLAQQAVNREAAAQLALRKGRAIEEALRNAAVALHLACNEAASYRGTQAIIDTAREQKLEDQVRDFGPKLQSQRESIDRRVRTYTETMQLLGKENATLVRDGLARAIKADNAVKALEQPLTADTDALLGSGKLPSVEQVLERCHADKPAPAG